MDNAVSRKKKRVGALIVLLALVYVGLTAFMWAKQRQLLYYPDRGVSDPMTYGLRGFEDLMLTDEDGTHVQAWYFPPREGWPLVIYFHGNAGHLGFRAPIFAGFTNAGFGVLGLSYRGYGKSEGDPTESGLIQDARAALLYARDTLHVPMEKVVLYGESLGTHFAARMGTELPVGVVALQAPFTSVAQRAAEIYYYLPVKLLIRDRYDTLGLIGNLKAPLLLFHGERDRIIPIKHGRELLEAAHEPKKGVFFPETGHNDFQPQQIVPELIRFCREHGILKR